MFAFVAAAAIGAFALSGCGGSSSTSELTIEEMTGSWVLESGSGPAGEIEAVDGVPVELEVDADGTFSGNAGCNNLFGKVTLEDGRLSIGPVASTMMACDEALMDRDQVYAVALEAVTHGSVDGDKLTLEGNDTKLVFTAK